MRFLIGSFLVAALATPAMADSNAQSQESLKPSKFKVSFVKTDHVSGAVFDIYEVSPEQKRLVRANITEYVLENSLQELNDKLYEDGISGYAAAGGIATAVVVFAVAAKLGYLNWTVVDKMIPNPSGFLNNLIYFQFAFLEAGIKIAAVAFPGYIAGQSAVYSISSKEATYVLAPSETGFDIYFESTKEMRQFLNAISEGL